MFKIFNQRAAAALLAAGLAFMRVRAIKTLTSLRKHHREL
jgi:hypothetical protein